MYYKLILISSLLSFTAMNANNDYTDVLVNSAYYDGLHLTYVIPPPAQFKMVVEPARTDGYSFGFIPTDAIYDSAGIIIGVTIINLIDEDTADHPFETIITEDTLEIRQFYGNTLEIQPADSMFNSNGEFVIAMKLRAPDRHIPTSLVAYYNGTTEMLIFEVLTKAWFPQYTASDILRECLTDFRVLRQKASKD